MKNEHDDLLRKAFRVLLKNGAGSKKAYKYILSWIENKVRIIIHSKNLSSFKDNSYYEDTVSSILENLISLAINDPNAWKRIEDFEGYVFMVCRNTVYNSDKSFLNREYLNFKEIFYTALGNLEKAGKLFSVNGKAATTTSIREIAGMDEIISTAGSLDFTVITKLGSKQWTTKKKNALGDLIMEFFNSLGKSARKEDLLSVFSKSLDIQIQRVETSEDINGFDLGNDYEQKLYTKNLISKSDSNLNPAELLLYQEAMNKTEEILRNSLNSLSDLERAVNLLHYSGKYTLREISEVLGVKRAQNIDYYLNKRGLLVSFGKIRDIFADLSPEGMNANELLALVETDLMEIFNKLVSEYRYNEN